MINKKIIKMREQSVFLESTLSLCTLLKDQPLSTQSSKISIDSSVSVSSTEALRDLFLISDAVPR